MNQQALRILSATEAQLRTLPGIGEARATAIVRARNQEVLDLHRLAMITGMNLGQWQELYTEGRISLERATAETPRSTARSSPEPRVSASEDDVMGPPMAPHNAAWRESPMVRQFHSAERESMKSSEGSPSSRSAAVSHRPDIDGVIRKEPLSGGHGASRSPLIA